MAHYPSPFAYQINSLKIYEFRAKAPVYKSYNYINLAYFNAIKCRNSRADAHLPSCNNVESDKSTTKFALICKHCNGHQSAIHMCVHVCMYVFMRAALSNFANYFHKACLVCKPKLLFQQCCIYLHVSIYLSVLATSK